MKAALPSKQLIHRQDIGDGRISLNFSPELIQELKLKDFKVPILAVDLGTEKNKDGLYKEVNQCFVEKVPNFLSKVERPRASNKKGTFASRNRKAPANELIVTWQGETYALGKQGAITGGSTNLDTDKTEELQVILRVLFALTLYDLGRNNEEVNLTIAINYEGESKFGRKEERIREAINSSISWGTIDGMRSVRVPNLKVDPEDYHAELFSRIYSKDGVSFEGSDRATIGIGFRTLNLGFIDGDGFYDVDRSTSFDNKGTSMFYEWVADEVGVKDWNNQAFIEAVNSTEQTYRPQGSSEEADLSSAIKLARKWYLETILKLIKKHTPSEINNFVLCGGGARPSMFGTDLSNKLWGQSMICPESDIANCAGQMVEMALEVQEKK